MIVAMHQPNFAPWLGFFDKMAHCDIFILLDTVQLVNRSYQNRTLLKSGNGPLWLTIPVLKKGRRYQLTRYVEFDETHDWRTTQLRTIRHVLGKAPHCAELLDYVTPIYDRRDVHALVDFNTALIREAVARLGIRTTLLMASELECTGSASRLILNLTKAVGGDVYLSGPTGRRYLEPEIFTAERVALRYHEFKPFEYPQRFGPFVPGLSSFDYLANVGFRLWPGAASQT